MDLSWKERQHAECEEWQGLDTRLGSRFISLVRKEVKVKSKRCISVHGVKKG